MRGAYVYVCKNRARMRARVYTRVDAQAGENEIVDRHRIRLVERATRHGSTGIRNEAI